MEREPICASPKFKTSAAAAADRLYNPISHGAGSLEDGLISSRVPCCRLWREGAAAPVSKRQPAVRTRVCLISISVASMRQSVHATERRRPSNTTAASGGCPTDETEHGPAACRARIASRSTSLVRLSVGRSVGPSDNTRRSVECSGGNWLHSMRAEEPTDASRDSEDARKPADRRRHPIGSRWDDDGRNE